MTIDDELAALRKERPKADTDLADTLVDLLEAILTPYEPQGRLGLSVPEAVDAYMVALNAHIDRRIGAYLRTVEVIG